MNGRMPAVSLTARARRFWRPDGGAVQHAIMSPDPALRAKTVRDLMDDAAEVGWIELWTTGPGLAGDPRVYRHSDDPAILLRHLDELLARRARRPIDLFVPAQDDRMPLLILDGGPIIARPEGLAVIRRITRIGPELGAALALVVSGRAAALAGDLAIRTCLSCTSTGPASALAADANAACVPQIALVPSLRRRRETRPIQVAALRAGTATAINATAGSGGNRPVSVSRGLTRKKRSP
jgi:hypothetical protein